MGKIIWSLVTLIGSYLVYKGLISHHDLLNHQTLPLVVFSPYYAQAVYTAPGVYARDVDLSAIVQNQATSVGAIVGQAQRGPVNKRALFTNVGGLTTINGNPNTNYGYAMHCGICALEEMTQLYFTRICVEGRYAGVLINQQGLQQSTTYKFSTGDGSSRIFAGILPMVPIVSLTSLNFGSGDVPVQVYEQQQIGLGDAVKTVFTSFLANAPISVLVTIMNGTTQINVQVDSLGNITAVGIASGYINFQTGQLTVTFSAPPAANAILTAQYQSTTGDASIFGVGITNGTINYISGVINVTFDTPPPAATNITATYVSDNPTTPLGEGILNEDPDAFPVNVTQIIGTGDNANPTFATTLTPTPIVTLLSILVGQTVIPVTVDSLGNITGSGISTGILEPAVGALEVTFDVAPGTGVSVSAVFNGSDTVDTCFMIYAENPGQWANNVSVQVQAVAWDPTAFRIIVQETSSGVSITKEVWEVSRVPNEKDGYGNNMYLETRINNISNFIRVLDNVDIPNTVMPAFTTYPIYFTQGDDGLTVSSGDVIQAWQLYTNQAVVDINILINGGYVSDNDWSVQESIQAIAEKRRDCFAIFDIPFDKTEISPITMASDWRLNYQNIESSFTALYSPWVLVYDSYNDIPSLPIPPSGFAAQVFARTDWVSYPWYAPAGYNRAVLTSETLPPMDVSVRYDQQGEIEALYGNPVNINPIVFSPGDGIVIFGQKTQQSMPSALDRINVRRLIITFERAAKQFLKYKLFELNNQYTRLDIETALNQYLATVQAQNGVYTFQVVCDETNNTPQIIDQNQLNVDVYLQPEKDAEFIQLQNIITATGANFTVIQQGFNLSIASSSGT
jgi:uncharacterized protein